MRNRNTMALFIALLMGIFLLVGAGITGAEAESPPYCPHDETVWHPLTVYEADNETVKCRFTHHHGHNPNDPELLALVDENGVPYFEPIEDVIGQQISYPWQTVGKDGVPENEGKHEATFWIVEIMKDQFGNPNCVPDPGFGPPCFKAMRIEVHGEFSRMGMGVQFHSFWAEIIADDGFGNIGYFASGGHYDTGCGYSKYFGIPLIPEEGETLEDSCRFPTMNNTVPYRVVYSEPQGTLMQRLFYSVRPRVMEIAALWGGGHGSFGRFVYASVDAWAWIDKYDPDIWEYLCKDDEFQCPFNNSKIGMRNMTVTPQSVSNLNTYTNVYGVEKPNCTEMGPNCVPKILRNWPKDKKVAWRAPAQYEWQGGNPNRRGVHEFDNSPGGRGVPGGEFYIKPLGYEDGGPHPTPTPTIIPTVTPTSTPCPCECDT